MHHWVGILSEEQFATERLYARDAVAVPPLAEPGGAGPEPGDPVVLVVAGEPPRLIGDGVVRGLVGARDRRMDGPGVLLAYRGRIFDDPAPVSPEVVGPAAAPGLHPLPPGQYTRLSALVSASVEAEAGRSVWFVSVALPIEASSRAEAVREFWTYLDKLGPQELPAYVWPLGDELAMQAFVLGGVANLDPEEDD